METRSFAIRCGINQATNIQGISKIIVIIDSIHSTQRIFNISHHPFQIHSVSILKELRKFFVQIHGNSIKFWKYSSQCNQLLHKVIDKKTKLFKSIPQYLCKLSQDFSKKIKCNKILLLWKMTFQALDLKRQQFLNLYNEDNNLLEPLYARGSVQFKHFRHSNSLCARAMRAITNHASIGEYRLRFFSQEDFSCLCDNYPIKTRHHIMHECRRYNEHWSPRRDMISYFVLFLKFNSRIFAFKSAIIQSLYSLAI